MLNFTYMASYTPNATIKRLNSASVPVHIRWTSAYPAGSRTNYFFTGFRDDCDAGVMPRMSFYGL